MAIVYRGPSNGQGITVYHDGVKMGSGIIRIESNQDNPSGIVKIGRQFDEQVGGPNGSVYLDELLFWNQQMSETDIQMAMDNLV